MTTITLAVDTSTIVCAGLAVDGQLVAARTVGDSRAHVELLTPIIQEMLQTNGLDFSEVTAFVVGVGPGPFTGLRVGISTARTLAWLNKVTPKGVCSLDVLALQWAGSSAPAVGEFVVVADARRKELYWAHYDCAGRRIGDPQVSAPGQLPQLPVAGPGVGVYPELFGARAVAQAPHHLDPGFMAVHADEFAAVGIEPLYLRRPDAELPSTHKSTLGSGRLRIKGARQGAQR